MRDFLEPHRPHPHKRRGLLPDAQTLRGTLHREMIHFGSLGRIQQGLIVFTVVALFMAGAFIFRYAIQLPGGQKTFPLDASIFIVAIFAVALSLVLTGAMMSHWFARAVVFVLLASVIGLFLLIGDTTIRAWIISNALVLLGAFVFIVLWGVVLYFAQREPLKTKREQTRNRDVWMVITFIFMLIVVLIAMALIVLRPYRENITNDTQLNLILILQVIWLTIIPVFLVTGSDYAEITETFAHAMIRHNRSPWRLTFYAAFWALATLGWTIGSLVLFNKAQLGGLLPLLQISLGASIIGLLVVLILLAALFTGLLEGIVRLEEIDHWPLRNVTYDMLVLAVPILIAFYIGASLASAWIYGLMLFVLLLISTFFGRFKSGRFQKNEWSVRTLFFFLVGLLGVISISIIRFDLGKSSVAEKIPGIEVLIAPITLLILIGMMVRGRINKDHAFLLGALFNLNFGLFVLIAISDTLQISSNRLVTVPPEAGIILVVALLWDLIMSGGEVTNKGTQSKEYPRPARILFYCGHVLLAASIASFFFILAKVSNAHLDPLYDPHSWVRFGILALGVPVLMTNFVLQVAFWRGRHHKTRRQRAVEAVQSAVGIMPDKTPRTLLRPR